MIDIPLEGETRTKSTKTAKTAKGAKAPIPQDVEYEIEVDNDSFFMYKKKPVATKQTETPAPEKILGKGLPVLDDPDTAESFAENSR